MSVCGIAGYVGTAENGRQMVRSLVAEQRHRGPDGHGLLERQGMVFGHARLAVIDLSAEANQPFESADGRHVLTYNGELYNYKELRRELQKLGRVFRSTSDTEVVLQAYQQWGKACVFRFIGMFAFAIWDTASEELFLARDRIGEKPLHYAFLPDGGFIFASEPAPLRNLADVNLALDLDGLSDYLQLNYTLGERTLNLGIRRLPAGYFATLTESGELASQSYWDLAHAFINKTEVSFENASEQLLALFDESVRMRMRSDVPFGTFLSGGLDSASITASMCRLQDASEVKSFTVAFSEKSFDESERAEITARALGTTHIAQTQSLDQTTLAEALMLMGEEPLGDTSFVPMLMLARMTRQHVTVALSGDGADEMLLGYPTYTADRLHRVSAPALKWAQPAIMGIVNRLFPARFEKVSFDYKLRQWVGGLDKSPNHAHFHWRSIFSPGELRELLDGDVYAQLDSQVSRSELDRHFASVADCHFLDQASYVDIKTWMVDDVLVKVDRTTMRHSLESRAPFLDHRLVEFAASLPVSYKRTLFGPGKRLLRHSQRHRLPRSALMGSKRGFNAPFSQWFNGELKSMLADQLVNKQSSLFRQDAVRKLVDEHHHQRRDNGLKLLSLMTLNAWS